MQLTWWLGLAWWLAFKIAPFVLLYPVLRYMVNRQRGRSTIELAGWRRILAIILGAVYGYFAARFLVELLTWARTG